MGVHGLTTYLRDHKLRLSKPIEFAEGSEPVSLVVDGWSFIYKLCLDTDLPWVYGGEYLEFCGAVTGVVRAWQAVGLKPIFVFDGPSPEKKFATIISRLNQSHVRRSLLFFRTSPASRSTRRFLHESRIIPPLILDACVQALLSMGDSADEEADTKARGVEIHFADEEADSFAVEIAGRCNGYIVGNDSDFVVLNCDGYEGFIHLDEMIWTTSTGAPEEAKQVEDDSFQTVKSKKKPPPNPGLLSGLLPPENLTGATLSATVYTPQLLAKYLDLPTSLLPLLGALVGNDYTSQSTASATSVYSPMATPRSSPPPSVKSFQSLIFERRNTPSQRIEVAAATMRKILHPPVTGKKRKTPESVVELIQLTVESLLEIVRLPVGLVALGQQENIVETVVEGTLPYAIAAPPPVEEIDPSVCLLHHPLDCFMRSIFDRGDDEDSNRVEMAASYVRAYRAGNLSPSLVDVLSTGTYWPELFLENPDIESVGRNLCRDIRAFGYALLDHGVGIPVAEEEDEQDSAVGDADNSSSEDEDGDEVIDVVETHSESEDGDVSSPLSEVDKLRGALRDLSFDEDDGEDDGEDQVEDGDFEIVSSSERSRSRVRSKSVPKYVTEYIRKGARVTEEVIEVPRLTEFAFLDETNPSPVQLRPTEDRLTVFLAFFESDTPGIRDLPAEDLQSALVVRCLVRQLHRRSASGSSERLKERWSTKEARAFLLSARASHSSVQEAKLQAMSPPDHTSERSIQLVAQVQMAMESIHHLAQILLITDLVPSFAHRFSGRLLHALLEQPENVLVGMMKGDATWDAVTADLGECFAEDRKTKKMKRKDKSQPAAKPTPTSNGRARSGMFGILSDMVDDD